MSKFGELIDVEIPVLLDFYTEGNEESIAMHSILRDVAATLGDKAKVIKIDVDKNMELAEALRVKGLPTLIIYKDGEMKWRHSGVENTNRLIEIIQEFV
ncbi:thioredoxin family protein [Winogradskyella eckloniae]|uniref:thioredoxin family protein n=1 Tax=Winogradskyella eckloniae TaxID=1089306 RepID=UPI001565E4DE|nr:thioredoxin family protein [Winogradskyella eckloniae]NRD18952.1 thioredoxin family protein [Winogradskyella eckloniae]